MLTLTVNKIYGTIKYVDISSAAPVLGNKTPKFKIIRRPISRLPSFPNNIFAIASPVSIQFPLSTGATASQLIPSRSQSSAECGAGRMCQLTLAAAINHRPTGAHLSLH